MPTDRRELALAALTALIDASPSFPLVQRSSEIQLDTSTESPVITVLDSGETVVERGSARLDLETEVSIVIDLRSANAAAVATDLNAARAQLRALLADPVATAAFQATYGWIEFTGSSGSQREAEDDRLGSMTLSYVLHLQESELDPYNL
jgi:hypothetical protein